MFCKGWQTHPLLRSFMIGRNHHLMNLLKRSDIDILSQLANVPNNTSLRIETAYPVLDDTAIIEDYEAQVLAEDPIVFAASKSDPDTLHFNYSMNANNVPELKKVMLQEVNAHIENEYWEVWAKADVPVCQDVLPAVWVFKHKHWIDTQAVYKYKV